jgi:hypothetical protein
MKKPQHRCVRQLLDGEASVESAQACLAGLTRDDLQRLIVERALEARLEAYRDRNHYSTTPLLQVSAQQTAAGWQQVLGSAPDKKHPIHRHGNRLKAIWEDLYDTMTRSPMGKLGLALALLILVFIPVLYQFEKPSSEFSTYEKGALGVPPASLQFSLVDPSGKLLRPDRIITEADTLAFRIELLMPGFVSIYIANGGRLDPIVSDQPLSKGTHDLSVGYTLTGNRGSNTLILLFAEAPMAIKVQRQQRLLIEAARNAVTSMTLEGKALFLTSQELDVH